MAARPGVVLAALAAALACAAGASASRLDPLGLHPFTTDEANPACVLWHDSSGITTRDCDPINVVFPNQTVAQVQWRLQAAGWVVVTDGAIQRLHWGDPMNWAPPDLQMGAAIAGTSRYHVRLWQVGPDVVGDAHHDAGSPHYVDLSWEAAEAFLAAPLCSTWCGRLPLPQQLAIQGGGTTWRGLANDAVATVIPVAPPPPSPPGAPPRRRHPRTGNPG